MSALIGWDHALFAAVNNWQGNPALDFFFRWCTELGAAYVAIPLGVLLVRTSGIKGDWTLAWRALAVGLPIGLLGTSLKLLFVRPRPLATLQDVHVLGPRLYDLSFPSGHSVTAFCMAGLLMALHPRVGLTWLCVAVFVGLSRVYVGAHFPTDVLAGALLGFVPSWLIGRKLFRDYNHHV